MKNIVRYIVCWMLLLGGANDILADVFESSANGNWNVDATWIKIRGNNANTIPSRDDDVVIKHRVNVNSSFSVNSIKVNYPGVLSFDDGGKNLTVNDFVNNWKVECMSNNNKITINGSFVNNYYFWIGGNNSNATQYGNSLHLNCDAQFGGSYNGVDAVFHSGGNYCTVYVYKNIEINKATNWSENGNGMLILYGRNERQLVKNKSSLNNLTLKVKNLKIENTSCGTNGTITDNNQGIHVADGINIEVSNKLTMANGVLHIGANNYVSVTKSGVDEQTAVATPGSGAGGALANQLHCYIDGRLIRYVRTNEVTLMPIGDGARSGYCTVKVRYKSSGFLGGWNKGNGTNTQWEARYYNHKSNVEGSNSDIYQYLAEEYWEVKNNGYSNGYGAQIQARVDKNLVDFDLTSSKKGTLSGIFKYDGSSNIGWTEMTNAYAKTEGKFNDGFAVINEDEDSGTGSTFKPTNDSPWMFTYGIKEAKIEEIKRELLNLGQQWSGKANDQKWENPANWLNGRVPDAGAVVKIESNYNVTINNTVFWFNVGNGNYPVVSASSGEAKAHDINLKSTLVESPAMLTIMDGGNLNVQNLLRVHSGSVHVNGQLSVVSNSFIKDEDDPHKGSLEIDANGRVSLQYSDVFGDIVNNGTLTLGNNIFLRSTSSFVGSGTTISTVYDAGAFAILNNGGNFAPTGTLEVKGNIENNNGGSFSIVDGTLRFTGTSGLQLFSNTVGTTNIGNLVVDNSNGVNVTNGSIEVTNELNLKNGVVTLANNNHIWLKGNTLNRTNGYIDGMLYRTLPSATDITKQYLFPVGDNGVYSYAKIGPNKSNDVVGVQYFNAKPTQGSGSELYGNLSSEYWKVVTKAGEQANNVYITLNYDNSDNFEPSLADYYTLAHYDGTRWTAYDRDDANNKAGIDAVNKLVYYKTGISVNNDGPYAHLFTLGYTKRVDRWTGSKSSAWSDDDNWSGGLVPSVMAFIPSLGAGAHNYPVIGSADNVGLTSVVVDGAQATLTIDGGTLNTDALTVTDNTNPGHVIINQRYDQSSNLIFGSTNYNGKFTINRTLKQNVLHYLGSATAEGTLTGFNSGAGDYMANYNAATEDYDNVSVSPQFPANWYGTSIGLKHSGAEIQQVGTIATGSVSMAAPLKSSSDWYGWNLLSNPYQVAFDMTKSFATFDHVEPVMWFRSFDDGSKTYRYTTYSVVAGVEVSQGKPGEEPVKNLAPQQAFFVRTTSPYATPRVVFNAPTSDLIVAAGTKLKAEKVADDLLRLTVGTDGAAYDEMAIVFRNGGSMMATQNDALKRFENSSYNQIYAVKDGNSYAIPFYPMADDVASTLIPIGVQLASGAEEGVITATNIDQFNASDVVLLHDFETGAVVDLREVSEYQFVAPAGQRINDRFAISLKSLYVDDEDLEEGTATGVGQAWTNSIMIVQNDNRDAIVSVPTEMLTNAAVVNVYDMAGKLVKKQNLEQTKTVVSLGDKKGVYVVEAVSGNTTERQKLRK